MGAETGQHGDGRACHVRHTEARRKGKFRKGENRLRWICYAKLESTQGEKEGGVGRAGWTSEHGYAMVLGYMERAFGLCNHFPHATVHHS